MAPHSALDSIELGPSARILVVRVGDMGDALLATPMLRALRQRYPAARIDLLTTANAATLLAECPLVDSLYTLPRQINEQGVSLDGLASLGRGALLVAGLRANRYHAVIFANHLTLPSGRRWRRALAATLGAPLTVGLDNGYGSFLRLRVPDDGFGAAHEVEYALALAARLDGILPDAERAPRLADLGWGDIRPATLAHGHPPHVALHPGSGAYSLARRWPSARYVELARALRDEFNAHVTLVGGPEERYLAASIITALGEPAWATNAVGATSPRRLAETLASAQLFIGNDSLPMHVAAAAGVPVIAIFGPSNARAWGPYAPGRRERVAVIRRADLPCSPCIYRGHALGTPQGCPPRPCLTELAIAPALVAARRLLRPARPAEAATRA
ncbi:MAG TPA: glycosyltransferase family 9 protein [Ktedonobacterales bacterium]|nr:glycosyltransferase family 9 protein [Ktedonobacterales bacterium]